MNTLLAPPPQKLPTGLVTFLFTDIQGSTLQMQRFPETMPRALARHNEILDEVIAAHGGVVFQVIGDAFCAAFADANNGVNAALAAQRALFFQDWGELGELRVRMGLHSGTAEVREGAYSSYLTLVRVQRLMSAGHGGQVLLSSATAELVRPHLPRDVVLRDLGEQKLKGLAQPERIFQLIAPDIPSEFPLLRVEAADASDSKALLEQLVRGKLIGRETELAQLRTHWELAQQARAHLVLLSGEPGVGKTRLANELVQTARNDSAIVLRGGCYEYEATTPYLPFVEAFRDWVRVQSTESLRRYLGSTAPEIVKFAPEIETKLGGILPNPSIGAQEDRLRMFDNVARFLQQLASATGLLFFIDDLHWADQGTLNLLHYLLRHLREQRVLILGAYREIELDRTHPLAASLVEWNREHLATRISLGRLSRDDTQVLVATLFGQKTISDDFVEVLYRETEGNPFFIEEVVKSLIEQGEVYRENGGWGRKEVQELAIPQSVKEAIGRRLNRLSEQCIEVLRCAAALGKVFSFEELNAVAGVREDALLDALDEASAAQLVRPNTDDTFAFTHDKIREVLVEELNPIRRRRLHQRIGERLEEFSEKMLGARVRVQDLAYHFTQSGDLERALKYSQRAAENAARLFALEEALGYYERAEEAAEALKNQARQAEIREAMGDLYSLQGVTPLAVAQYEKAIALVTTNSQRGALHAKIGRDYAQVGDARGVGSLELALAELDPVTQSNELALATAALGRYHHYHAQHHRALEFLERAILIAESSRDAETLNYVYLYLAGAYQHLLRNDESMEWARKAIALGERENFPIAIANGHEFLGEDAMNQGRWEDALFHAQKDREFAERTGALDRRAWADYISGWTRHLMGDLAAAEKHANDSLVLSQQVGDLRLTIMTAAIVTEIKTDRGAFKEAYEVGSEALKQSDSLKHIVIQAMTRHALAHLCLAQKDVTGAQRYLDEALELLAPSDNQWTRLVMGATLAEAYLFAGRFDDARDAADDNLARAQFGGSPHFEGVMRRIKGQILAAQDNTESARREFDSAIEIHTSTQSRLDLARDYQQRGLLRQTLGDVDNAEDDLQRAKQMFAECGAYVE